MQNTHLRDLWTHLSRGGLQSTHSKQVVGRAHEVGVQLHPRETASERAAQATIGLHPAEDFLDALSLSLTDGVSGMTGGARIEPRGVAAFDSCNVGSDALLSQMRHKVLTVIPLLTPERGGTNALSRLTREYLFGGLSLGLDRRAHVQVHAQAVAVLHERVRPVAELGLFAFALAQELGFVVGGGFVRVIGAPLATEVHHAARAITARGRSILRFEALEARPRFNQSTVHC